MRLFAGGVEGFDIGRNKIDRFNEAVSQATLDDLRHANKSKVRALCSRVAKGQENPQGAQGEMCSPSVGGGVVSTVVRTE